MVEATKIRREDHKTTKAPPHGGHEEENSSLFVIFVDRVSAFVVLGERRPTTKARFTKARKTNPIFNDR